MESSAFRSTLHRGILACATAVATVVSTGAAAQTWPSRPITWLYPFGESAATVWVRTLAQEVSKTLGQQVLVENRPGMGGRIGMNAIVAGKPDGHLISIGTTSMLVYQPLTSPTFKIEPVKSYTPITQIYTLKMVIYATTKVPFNDIKGMVSYAKANPGKLNFGSTGIGSTGHFAMELLNAAAGIAMVHVPYKGEGDQTTAAINGELHLFITAGGPKQHVEAGRLQAIATSGGMRAPLFPEKLTVREQGLDFEMTQWMGVVAPPGLPADITARLGAAIRAAMKEPAPTKAAQVAGVEPTPSSSAESFTALIRSDLKLLEPVVKKTGIVTE